MQLEVDESEIEMVSTILLYKFLNFYVSLKNLNEFYFLIDHRYSLFSLFIYLFIEKKGKKLKKYHHYKLFLKIQAKFDQVLI